MTEETQAPAESEEKLAGKYGKGATLLLQNAFSIVERYPNMNGFALIVTDPGSISFLVQQGGASSAYPFLMSGLAIATQDILAKLRGGIVAEKVEADAGSSDGNDDNSAAEAAGEISGGT